MFCFWFFVMSPEAKTKMKNPEDRPPAAGSNQQVIGRLHLFVVQRQHRMDISLTVPLLGVFV